MALDPRPGAGGRLKSAGNYADYEIVSGVELRQAEVPRRKRYRRFFIDVLWWMVIAAVSFVVGAVANGLRLGDQ